MLWKEKYTVQKTCKELDGLNHNTPITIQRLQAGLNYYQINGINLTTNHGQWTALGYVIGKHNKFKNIYADSLAVMLSGFATEQPQSAGTELYIKENNVEDYIISEYNKLTKYHISEKELFIKIMNLIINLYLTGNIKNYEKSVYRITTYITHSENETYKTVPGNNNHEKFQTLLNIYKLQSKPLNMG